MTTPVENLQREWQLKKANTKATQAKAAKALGWTQSAFSQYLNGTTELNTKAVIKLAAYLEVPPWDIDPSLTMLNGKLYCPKCMEYITIETDQ